MGLKESGQIGGAPRAPDQSRHRLARGARLAVRSDRRTRHLQDHRRRQDLEEDAVRRQRARRARHRGRLAEPERALRGDLSRLPQGLGHHQRRSGRQGRHLQVDRRRRHVEEGQRRSAVEADRQDRSRHRAQQPEGALRDDRSARQRRRTLQVERRRRDVDARQQQPAAARAAVLLQLRQRQSEERERGLRQRARVPQVDRRRQDVHRDGDAARRQPRHVDQSGQPGHHPAGQRRRRQRAR